MEWEWDLEAGPSLEVSLVVGSGMGSGVGLALSARAAKFDAALPTTTHSPLAFSCGPPVTVSGTVCLGVGSASIVSDVFLFSFFFFFFLVALGRSAACLAVLA